MTRGGIPEKNANFGRRSHRPLSLLRFDMLWFDAAFGSLDIDRKDRSLARTEKVS